MQNSVLGQKELYKNHLEFLGYQIEEDPNDEQEMTITLNGRRTFVKVFRNGFRATLIYGISEKAKNVWLPFLTFLNECNSNRIAQVSTFSDMFVIDMWYLSPYDKISFGEFLQLFDDESQKILTDASGKDFLA